MYRVKYKSENKYWARMYSHPTFNKIGTLIPKKSVAESTIQRLYEYHKGWKNDGGILEIEEVEIIVKGIVE